MGLGVFPPQAALPCLGDPEGVPGEAEGCPGVAPDSGSQWGLLGLGPLRGEAGACVPALCSPAPRTGCCWRRLSSALSSSPHSSGPLLWTVLCLLGPRRIKGSLSLGQVGLKTWDDGTPHGSGLQPTASCPFP